MLSPEDVEQFLSSPKETFSVELKAWFDPKNPSGIAKIAKAAIALRNRDGGCLVIGVSDSGVLDSANTPNDIEELFSQDSIQEIVTKYADPSFAVHTQTHHPVNGTVVVITIPSGVTVPTCAKRDLFAADSSERLLEDHAVYVRTLISNNRVSSAKARRGDWSELVRICMDNREADVARFLRRHISVDQLTTLVAAMQQTMMIGLPADSLDESILENGFSRFIERDSLLSKSIAGTWEIGAALKGQFQKQTPNIEFLQSISTLTLRLSGWPPWCVLWNQSVGHATPRFAKNNWEALLDFRDGSGSGRHLDFWRISGDGCWYHLRALEDDFEADSIAPETAFDPFITIRRVMETFAVLQSMTKAFNAEVENTSLDVSMRWRGLGGRQLISWAKPGWSLRRSGECIDMEISNSVNLPNAARKWSLVPFAKQMLTPVFLAFEGQEFHDSVYESIARELFGDR